MQLLQHNQTGANVYLMTKRGQLMPAIYIGDGEKPYLCEIASRDGIVYSVQRVNVYDEISGKLMLLQKRGERLAQDGYQVRIRKDGSFRVWHPVRHGDEKNAGYILTPCSAPAQIHCRCKSWDQDHGCKHSEGLAALLYAAARRATDAGRHEEAGKVARIAQRIAFGCGPED